MKSILHFTVLLFSVFSSISSYGKVSNSCRKVGSYMCAPLTPQQELSVNMCQIEMKNAKCDEFFKRHPELDKEKQRNCETLATCPLPTKVAEYTKACLENWGAAWKDILVGVYQVVAGNVTIREETKEREHFFKTCTTADCKRKMLGDYAELFSKEEIEGHPNTKNLDPKDPVNKNYLEGLSSKVLYKKLLERISKKMRDGTLEQPIIEPWSGKPAKPLKSAQEKIDNALSKMGIKNTACYDPEVLWEMRCYALFTVLDPLLFTYAAQKTAVFLKKSLAKEASTTRLVAGPLEERSAIERKMKTESTGEFTVESHLKSQTDALDRMGVKYEDLRKSPNRKDREYLFSNDQLKRNEHPNYIEGLDELFDVTKGAKQKKARSGSTTAFEHPDFEEALAKIHDNDYRLVVDTTLDLPTSKTDAIHSGVSKIIAIRPSSTWATLVHELQHMDFEKHLKAQYESASISVKSGKSLNEILPDDAKAAYTRKELVELEKLMKVDAPKLAANERLSGMREVRELGARRFLTMDAFVGLNGNAYEYTDHFMLKFLEEQKSTGALTQAQAKYLKEIKSRARTEQAVSSLGLNTAIGVPLAGSAYMIYDTVTGDTYVKMRSEDIWSLIKPKKPK